MVEQDSNGYRLDVEKALKITYDPMDLKKFS